MAQPVQFAIPVHSKWVPECLDRILDKKVSGAALSCIEKLVDWICSVIYCPINRSIKPNRKGSIFLVMG